MTRLIAWITRQIPEWIAWLRNVPWNTICTKPRWLRHALIVCVAVILLWVFWSANETIPTETSKTSGRQANAATVSLFGEERLESDDMLNLRHCFAKSKLNDYTLDSGRVLVSSDRVSAYLEALQQSKWKPTGSQERLEQALQRASSPMLTSDLRSKRLQLAEQERLGRQIETFDGIAEAIVSYEVENSGGFSRGKTARAAVMIRNQPDATLSVERAAAILDYVLCSVSGLKPENVVLIDRDTNRRFLGENLRRASLELDPRTLYRLAQEERLEKILASELASLGEPEIRIAVTAIPQITPRLPTADHMPVAATPVTANVPVAENVPITPQTENIPAENTANPNVRFHVGDTGHYVGYTPVEPVTVPTSEGTESHFDASERIPRSEFRENLANGEMATRMTHFGTIGTLDVTDLATGFAAVTAPLTDMPNPTTDVPNSTTETNRSIQSSASSQSPLSVQPSVSPGEVDSVSSMDMPDLNFSTRTPTPTVLMESDRSVESSSATSLQANCPVALPEGLTLMETSTRQETSGKTRFFESSQGSESSQEASTASALPSEQRSSSQMMVQPMSSTWRPLNGASSTDGANEPSPILLLNATHRLPRDHRVMETAMRMEYPEEPSCEPSQWSFAVSIEIPSRWFVQRWNRYRTQMTNEVATQEAFNQFRRRELSSIAQRLQQVVPAEFTCDLSVTELDNGQPDVLPDVTEPNTSLPWLAILCGTLVLAWVGYRSILSRYFSSVSDFATSSATVPSASDTLVSSDSSWTSSAVPHVPQTASSTSQKRPLAGHAAATYDRANASIQETVCEPNHSGIDHSVMNGSVIDQAMMNDESETKTSENRLPLPSESFERVVNVENEDMSENLAEPLEGQAAVPTDFDVLETDELDETVLRREIREAILRDPAHASSVLRSWLGEVDPNDHSIIH